MKSSRVCWRPGPSGFSRNKYTQHVLACELGGVRPSVYIPRKGYLTIPQLTAQRHKYAQRSLSNNVHEPLKVKRITRLCSRASLAEPEHRLPCYSRRSPPPCPRRSPGATSSARVRVPTPLLPGQKSLAPSRAR